MELHINLIQTEVKLIISLWKWLTFNYKSVTITLVFGSGRREDQTAGGACQQCLPTVPPHHREKGRQEGHVVVVVVSYASLTTGMPLGNFFNYYRTLIKGRGSDRRRVCVCVCVCSSGRTPRSIRAGGWAPLVDGWMAEASMTVMDN